MSVLATAVLVCCAAVVLGYPTPVPVQGQPGQGNPGYEMFRTFASTLPGYANPFNYIPGGALPGGYPGAGYVPQYPPFGPYGPYAGGAPGGQFGGGQFGQPFPGQAPGGGYGQQIPNSYGNGLPQVSPGGMGFSGPYFGTGYGNPNPAYGNIGQTTTYSGGAGGAGTNAGNRSPGTVPVVTTRFGGGAPGSGSTVTRSKDGNYVSVAVQGSPDGQPQFRSETVRGPNSYGTAFAFSSP